MRRPIIVYARELEDAHKELVAHLVGDKQVDKLTFLLMQHFDQTLQALIHGEELPPKPFAG
jgi:hypothetical protein